jgi:hypothetical protein
MRLLLSEVRYGDFDFGQWWESDFAVKDGSQEDSGAKL